MRVLCPTLVAVLAHSGPWCIAPHHGIHFNSIQIIVSMQNLLRRKRKAHNIFSSQILGTHKSSIYNWYSETPRDRTSLGSQEGVLQASSRIYQKAPRTLRGIHHWCRGLLPNITAFISHFVSQKSCVFPLQFPFFCGPGALPSIFWEAKWMLFLSIWNCLVGGLFFPLCSFSSLWKLRNGEEN